MRTAILSFLFVLLLSVSGYCADVTLSWNAQPGAIKYKVFRTVKATVDGCEFIEWSAGIDVGVNLTYTFTDVQDWESFTVGAHLAKDPPNHIGLWSEAIAQENENFGLTIE